jgi:transcriptional regulator with XRE-family HTH domain
MESYRDEIKESCFLTSRSSRVLHVLACVKFDAYSVLVTQDEDWSAEITRLVAREVRRYREQRRPKLSTQQLADRTAELGMPIPRSVLANLESGRRDSVSVAEVLVLAAALDVAPIDLICPVGFDKTTEMLPGREMDPLVARRWFTGAWKLDIDDAGAWVMRTPGTAEQSNAYLLEYHDGLVTQLRAKEADAARAAAASAAADEASVTSAIKAHDAEEAEIAAKAAGDAAAPDLQWAAVDAHAALDNAGRDRFAKAAELHYKMQAVTEWREFIREPLRRTREEISRRGMLLPDLPADVELGEGNG